MIFASRVLNRGANRWANTIAAAITTVFVVGGGSLVPHYVFFAAVELACMALIVWSVWSPRARLAHHVGPTSEVEAGGES
jgi:hypothetical protein